LGFLKAKEIAMHEEPFSPLFSPPVNQAVARRIINALRRGQPPHENVGNINVGYDTLLDYFREKLDELRDFDTSDVKFINANYGCGKSHFLDLVRLLAFERDFVVSRVELSQREAPFDKLEIVVRQIMANVATAEFREAGLERLLRKWARGVRGTTQADIFGTLESIPMADLRVKLVDFANACSAEPPAESRIAALLKWFRGEETRSKTFSSVQQYLSSLTRFFRLIGYSGFVIMLDEAEAISSLTRTRGEVANENIRQIIDNDRNTEGFYFIFASTPYFFDPPTGSQVRHGDPISIYSYAALRRRVENLPRLTDPSSPDSVIVQLPDLTVDDDLQLAKRIRDLAEQAYGEPSTPITDSDLDVLVRYARATDSRVATLVRAVVIVCDQARRPDFSFRDRYELIVEDVREQVDRQANE
jgi:hypothetical protein